MTTGTTTSGIAIRDIAEIGEMRAVEEMQREAWGIDDLSIVPYTQLSAAVHVGGTLLGAFDGDRLVGFVYGFYGHFRNEVVHHSHMLAVDPEYRDKNLGFRLKADQLNRVRGDGFAKRMTWTFDPLRSLNAYFNFAKLGVVSDTYLVNVYGEDAASFMHRTGTDRLLVSWFVNSERVLSVLADAGGGSYATKTDPRSEIEYLLRVSESGLPVREATIRGQERLAIEIPADIGEVEKSDLKAAKLWRGGTRNAFLEALRAGFIATGFRREGEGSGSYVLERTGIDQYR
ncbi:MAG: GNAT family N-acetyltransferase [Acidobacteria bacterium]|nr:MAG: GNAT family N-acetyltransferase [Acidobacteriota bacterium]REK01660.1 MAG: GNAT family N-acetyltransferase [Acidobacteriota bacterium]REK14616.1 MAG: GNAT family N-acetyltransferase [Acidobacteriota bacterium]REK45331.1 MAG: GNAT family N-acetyltransferase [Acidobacteriota bacterium]